ncbi:sigma 54-interacting transcriptional regulator [Noviherbaspirillum sp. 1P10PC]|uniref:sigma-54-dependent transcriptional regulator n=1 Tax=Noviherbaspirillum sp. 1P10PC TaxID=3132292 RepID=UPI0039A1B0EB
MWKLLAAGAADVYAWINEEDGLQEVVAARLRRWWDLESLLVSAEARRRLVGNSRCWTRMLRHIVEAASLTQEAILITGESGTGKEMVARLIHEVDGRPDKTALVTVDCTTLTAELAGSELFGHERGAFTGAANPREGAVAQADGGTLFLDEVGELPLPLQAQLLRAIQERTYKRLGSNTWQHSHFRLVCATNRDLEAEVARGAFRGDLYYRMAGWTFTTPPLRERSEDILPLALHFLGEADPYRVPIMDQAVSRFLLTRDYPGNVRDLRRIVLRLARRHAGPGPITAGDIPEDERPPGQQPRENTLDKCLEAAVREALDLGIGLKDLSHLVAQSAIHTALEREQGSLHRAAHRLGVTDRALQMRCASERAGH